MSRDFHKNNIYDVTINAKMLATLTQPRLSCISVTITARYSTSNVASFTADCKAIMLVYYVLLYPIWQSKTVGPL